MLINDHHDLCWNVKNVLYFTLLSKYFWQSQFVLLAFGYAILTCNAAGERTPEWRVKIISLWKINISEQVTDCNWSHINNNKI